MGRVKKYRFPVAFHLKQAVGALTHHTGAALIFLKNQIFSMKNY
jgi:hypothetical protein